VAPSTGVKRNLRMNRDSVDAYLRDGCGRCEHYQTPQCKVHAWTDALRVLRAVALDAGLTETMKWGSPCYMLGDANVAMLVAFRESCALSFFQGAGLDDPEGVLESPGPNSRFGRYFRFRSAMEVATRRSAIDRLLAQAVALARSGEKLAVAPAAEPVPEELERLLAADPGLRRAFEALTPGRRRSHILHVAGAKQSETRARRAEKCAPEIRAGRGFQER
jgi:uncharacterized protein YdeI (YjbR/CyaY-like superfamily)